MLVGSRFGPSALFYTFGMEQAASSSNMEENGGLTVDQQIAIVRLTIDAIEAEGPAKKMTSCSTDAQAVDSGSLQGPVFSMEPAATSSNIDENGGLTIDQQIAIVRLTIDGIERYPPSPTFSGYEDANDNENAEEEGSGEAPAKNMTSCSSDAQAADSGSLQGPVFSMSKVHLFTGGLLDHQIAVARPTMDAIERYPPSPAFSGYDDANNNENAEEGGSGEAPAKKMRSCSPDAQAEQASSDLQQMQAAGP